MSDILAELSTAVIEGNVDDMADLTEDALDEDLSAQDILDKGLMPGMDHVGVEFKAGNMFVPEVLRSARAMHNSMDLIRPLLAEAGASMTGKMVIGTVKGDLHDIGKNIEPEAFVEAVKEHEPDILSMSALLTTTMRSMEHTIKALEEAGLRDKVKVMIGGAPVTQSFSDQIGADGYASNAASAAELAKKFVN